MQECMPQPSHSNFSHQISTFSSQHLPRHFRFPVHLKCSWALSQKSSHNIENLFCGSVLFFHAANLIRLAITQHDIPGSIVCCACVLQRAYIKEVLSTLSGNDFRITGSRSLRVGGWCYSPILLICGDAFQCFPSWSFAPRWDL